MIPQTGESNIQYTFLKEQITKNAKLNIWKYKYNIHAPKCSLGRQLTDRGKIWPGICKDTLYINEAGQNMTSIKDECGNISFIH